MADQSIAEIMKAFWGGGATSLFGAVIGQLAHHGSEVGKNHRKFLGPELLWAPPVAVFTALCGEALGDFWHWDQSVMTGVTAVLGFLGPYTVTRIAEGWLSKKGDDDADHS